MDDGIVENKNGPRFCWFASVKCLFPVDEPRNKNRPHWKTYFDFYWYFQVMNNEQKNIYYEVGKILWNEWDPLGVNDIAPKDEYQSYSPALSLLKLNGASTSILAQKIFDLETKTLGLPGDLERCQRIAKKIYDL